MYILLLRLLPTHIRMVPPDILPCSMLHATETAAHALRYQLAYFPGVSILSFGSDHIIVDKQLITAPAACSFAAQKISWDLSGTRLALAPDNYLYAQVSVHACLKVWPGCDHHMGPVRHPAGAGARQLPICTGRCSCLPQSVTWV